MVLLKLLGTAVLAGMVVMAVFVVGAALFYVAALVRTWGD